MSTPSPIIEVRNLRRTFDAVRAVNDISFAVPRGSVVGFIGANGAGKTTTMRMMVTLEMQDSGHISMAGFDTLNHPGEVRRRVGWMPDSFGTYDNVTVWEYLDFYARAYGYKGSDRTARIREVMDFTDLTPLAERFTNKLSKGMGQRLCLGRTLLHDPEILIMDEPAAGLDPKARMEFKRLINLLAASGKTIFISSHILSELGEMCHSLLFIDKGQIIHHGTAEDLRTDRQTLVVEVLVSGSPEILIQWAGMNPGVSVVDTLKNGARLGFDENNPEALARVLKKMILDGVPVLDFHRQERRLEDAFIDILRKIQ
ncbi:MAG: ABC transporter ATP-binding protein [Verrucomicrobiae bacterium]|nr:ABC transporter ATP-binding protein [Verrucomicrobiae bacterium]